MHRYLYFSVIILLTSILVISCSRQPVSREANVTISIHKEKKIKGIDLFLLIDESGSMYGQEGTDPTGLRYEASKYLIQNLLVKRSNPKAPHRISVIHFGDKAKLNNFVDVVPKNAQKLVQSVQWIGKHMGNTGFIQALRAVKDISELEKSTIYKREHKIVLLTDGTPDDRRRNRMTQADYFAEIEQYIKEKLDTFTLYVVGIDNPKISDRFGQTARKWKQVVGENNVFVVEELRDLYTSFNNAIRSIFEIPPITPDFVSENQTFEVQPYLDGLEFHLFTPSGMQLGIYRPDGELIKTDDSDVTYKKGKEYDILIVDTPSAGIWQYRILEGKGKVSVVFRNPIPFKLTLLEPSEVFPLGKKMRLKARFTSDNGEPVEEVAEYPLAFVAKVISPDQTEFNLQFLSSDQNKETYIGNIDIPTEQAGEYLIRLTVKGGHKFETTSTERVFVQSFPYIQPLIPESKQAIARPSAGLECQVQLFRDGTSTEPEKEFVDNPNTLILAQIIDMTDVKESQTVWMDYQPDSQRFSAFIPYKFQKEEGYTIAYQLKGEPRIKNRLIPASTVETVRFYTKPNPWDKAVPVLLILVALAVIYLIVLILYLSSAKRITASLDVMKLTGESKTIFLDNQKWFKPRKLKGYTDEDGTSYPPISFWGRGRNEESIRLFVGGWMSLLTGGIFSKRKTILSKGDESDVLIPIFSKLRQPKIVKDFLPILMFLDHS